MRIRENGNLQETESDQHAGVWDVVGPSGGDALGCTRDACAPRKIRPFVFESDFPVACIKFKGQIFSVILIVLVFGHNGYLPEGRACTNNEIII